MITGPDVETGARHEKEAIKPKTAECASNMVWKIQGAGLVLMTFMSFFPKLSHVEVYLFFILLLSALVTAWLNGEAIWVRTALDLPLMLFLAWVLLTVPFATDVTYSFSEWRKLAAKILVFYWAMFVLRVQPHRRTVVRGVLVAIIIATAIVGGYALVDFLVQGGSWKDRYVEGVGAFVRARSPSSDFQWLSTYMVMVIPLLMSANVMFRGKWQRATCAFIAGLAVLIQGISYVRAGWLGLAAEGLAVGFFTKRRRLALWVLTGCTIVLVGTFAASQAGYQRDTLDPWTLYARFAVWKLMLSDIMQHPLVGVGYGADTFMMRFSNYPETTKAVGPHSTFLMVILGSGIPALILLVWVLFNAVRTFVRLAGRVTDRGTYALLIGTATMVVGFAVRNLFDYMFAGSLAYLFWLLVATALAQGTAEAAPES
jgi:O-antigen ligase